MSEPTLHRRGFIAGTIAAAGAALMGKPWGDSDSDGYRNTLLSTMERIQTANEMRALYGV